MERLDDLLIDNMKIFQRLDQFRFSIDAVILSHFVTVNPHHRYADFGTGTGVIPLLLTARGITNITGIEVNPIMAKLAQKSVSYNKKDDYITIIEGDYRDNSKLSEIKIFDHIIMNPPYRSLGCGDISINKDRAMALHETETTLEEALKAVKRKLRFGGKISLIYLPEKLVEVLSLMQSLKLEPKRLRFVHSYAQEKAKLVLIEGKYGANPGLETLAPLYIYKGQDVYSEEVCRWYDR